MGEENVSSSISPCSFSPLRLSKLLHQAALDSSKFQELKDLIGKKSSCRIDSETFHAFGSLFTHKSSWIENDSAVQTVFEAFCFVVECNTKWGNNGKNWLWLTVNIFEVLLVIQNEGGKFFSIILDGALQTLASKMASITKFVVKTATTWLSTKKDTYLGYSLALSAFEKFVLANKDALTIDFKQSILKEVIAFSDMITKVGDYGIQLTILSVLKDLTALSNVKVMFPSLPKTIKKEFEQTSCAELLKGSRKFLNSCNSHVLSDIGVYSVHFHEFICDGFLTPSDGIWLTINPWSETLKLFSDNETLLQIIPFKVFFEYDSKAASDSGNLKMILQEVETERHVKTDPSGISNEMLEKLHTFLREQSFWQELKELSQAIINRGDQTAAAAIEQTATEFSDQCAIPLPNRNALGNEERSVSNFVPEQLSGHSNYKFSEVKQNYKNVTNNTLSIFGVNNNDFALVEENDCTVIGIFPSTTRNGDKDNTPNFVNPFHIKSEATMFVPERSNESSCKNSEAFNNIIELKLNLRTAETDHPSSQHPVSFINQTQSSDLAEKSGFGQEEGGIQNVPLEANDMVSSINDPYELSTISSVDSETLNSNAYQNCSHDLPNTQPAEFSISPSANEKIKSVIDQPSTAVSTSNIHEDVMHLMNNTETPSAAERAITGKKRVYSTLEVILNSERERGLINKRLKKASQNNNVPREGDFPRRQNSISLDSSEKAGCKNMRRRSCQKKLRLRDLSDFPRDDNAITQNTDRFFSLQTLQSKRIAASAFFKCRDVVMNFKQQIHLLEKEALRQLDIISVDGSTELNNANVSILDLATASENNLERSLVFLKECLHLPETSEDSSQAERIKRQITKQEHELNNVIQARQQLIKKYLDQRNSPSTGLINGTIGKFKKEIFKVTGYHYYK